MKLTCTTYRNKNVDIKWTNGNLFMDDMELKHIKKTYFYPCALNRGDAHLIVVFDSAPQNDGKTVYFFRRNWLSKPIKKMDDDHKVVDQLNAAIEAYASNTLDQSFEGQVDKTWDMHDIFITEDGFISPDAKLYKEFKDIDCIFFERLTSYTRTFDMALVSGDSKLGISAIHRKNSLQMIKSKLQSTTVYETGPDPLPWDNLFRQRKQQGVSWQQLHEMVSNQEEDDFDNESDWAPGETDEEEEEEEEYDYPSEEEEEEFIESEEDYSDDNEEYDTYVKKTSKKRVFQDSDNEEVSNKRTKV